MDEIIEIIKLKLNRHVGLLSVYNQTIIPYTTSQIRMNQVISTLSNGLGMIIGPSSMVSGNNSIAFGAANMVLPYLGMIWAVSLPNTLYSVGLMNAKS